MPDSDSALLNIQENLKTYEKEVRLVRGWMRSQTLLGQVLRVLVRRLKCSYTREPIDDPLELQVLLLLSLAEVEPLAWNKSNAAQQAGRL